MSKCYHVAYYFRLSDGTNSQIYEALFNDEDDEELRDMRLAPCVVIVMEGKFSNEKEEAADDC